MNRADLYGLEYDWYATDRDGHIGHFSSAGNGPIPRRVLDSPAIRANLNEFTRSLPTVARLVDDAVSGNREDWLQMAERGLFSYDYLGSERSYVLIARPSTPVSIEAYPEMVELALALPILTDRCFALAESLSAEDIFDCG